MFMFVYDAVFPVCPWLYLTQPFARVVWQWIISSHISHGPLLQSCASARQSESVFCLLSPKIGGAGIVCLFYLPLNKKKTSYVWQGLASNAVPLTSSFPTTLTRFVGNPTSPTVQSVSFSVVQQCHLSCSPCNCILLPPTTSSVTTRPPCSPSPPPPPPLPYRRPTLLSEPAGL